MTSNRTRRVSVQRIISAPAASIFVILADPSAHWVIDGSKALRPPNDAAAKPLRAGSVFITPMSRRLRGLTAVHLVQVAVALLVRGRMRNTVVEFEKDRRIAWRNFGHHVWRYELQPLDDGSGARTLVRETFDYAPNLAPWLLEWAGFPAHNARTMHQTLKSLDKVLSANSR
jgi:hypothetical protein